MQDVIKIRNKQATNALARITSKSNFVNDMGVMTLSMQYGSASLTFTLTNTAVVLNQMAQKIFRVLTGELSAKNNSTISMSLQEIMSMLGLKDKDNFRATLNKSLEALQALRISGSCKSDHFSFVVLPKYWIANSVLTVKFDDDFYTYIQGRSVLTYPVRALQIESSARRHPYSFLLVDKLIEQKNICRSSSFKIKVETLLKVCIDNGLPTYEAVKATSRDFTHRIIEPFERDLNHLDDVLTWSYEGDRPPKYVDWVGGYINVCFK